MTYYSMCGAASEAVCPGRADQRRRMRSPAEIWRREGSTFRGSVAAPAAAAAAASKVACKPGESKPLKPPAAQAQSSVRAGE